jgi:hypothetical protein
MTERSEVIIQRRGAGTVAQRAGGRHQRSDRMSERIIGSVPREGIAERSGAIA